MSTVGFIGLGTMGLPMAANLLRAGHRVQGYDLDDDAVSRAEESGVLIAASAWAAAQGAEVVMTMLPKGAHVRDVLLGEEGLLDRLPAGTLVIDCSSIDVTTTREIHAHAESLDLGFLDAPVSGGVGGARAGTLTFMVGGRDDVLERARPLFSAIGAKTVHAGGAGAGQITKACNQLVFGASLAAVAEAFVMADRLGVEARTLFDIMSSASADCWALRNACPWPGVVEGSAADAGYEAKFSAALLAKDLGLAEGVAEAGGVQLVLGQAAREQFEALAQHSGHLDVSAIVTLVDTIGGRLVERA